jgi:hypothetical protein
LLRAPRTPECFSHHFIFFVTYEWAQKARVFHYTRLETFVIDKQSSLLGLFISYIFYRVVNMTLSKQTLNTVTCVFADKNARVNASLSCIQPIKTFILDPMF